MPNLGQWVEVFPPLNLWNYPNKMLTAKDIQIYKDENPKQPAPGVKYDTEKPPLQLLDPIALEGIANVLAFGAKKYAAHNWRGGIEYSRLLGAVMRHTNAILRGEDNDPESGLPHVDHLGCSVMFLSNMMKTRKDLDDRYNSK